MGIERQSKFSVGYLKSIEKYFEDLKKFKEKTVFTRNTKRKESEGV